MIVLYTVSLSLKWVQNVKDGRWIWKAYKSIVFNICLKLFKYIKLKNSTMQACLADTLIYPVTELVYISAIRRTEYASFANGI